MSGIKRWNEFFKTFRKQNATLPFKQQQKKASKIWRLGVNTIKKLKKHTRGLGVLDKNKKLKKPKYKQDFETAGGLDKIDHMMAFKLQNINNDKIYNGKLKLKFSIMISQDIIERSAETIAINIRGEDLVVRALNGFKRDWNGILLNGVHLQTAEFTPFTRNKQTIKKMSIWANEYIKLPYDIKSNNAVIKYNCVYSALEQLATKATPFKKMLKDAKIKESWTVEELIIFLRKYTIPYKLYGRDLKKLYESDYENKKKIKGFYAIVSNEHIYTTTKAELALLKKDIYNKEEIKKVVVSDNIIQTIKDNRTKQKIYNLNADTENEEVIISKAHMGNILYTDDKEIKESFDMTKKIIGNIPIPYTFKKEYMLNKIADKYDLKSTFTHNINKPKPFNYKNMLGISENDNIMCIDANKCYSSILMNLKYVPKITAENAPQKYNNEEIIDYNFYHVSHLYRNTYGILYSGWMSGYRLKHFKDTAKIDYYIEPVLIENPYTEIIKEMYKYNKNISKSIINKFIGTMQLKKEPGREFITNYKLYNNLNEIEGNYYTISNDMYIGYDIKEDNIKYNESLLLLSHYILDSAIMAIFNKINELKKMDKDIQIIKIETDSIAFKSDKIKYEMLNLNNELGGWKKIKFEYEKEGQRIYHGDTDEDEEEEDFEKVTKLKIRKEININKSCLILGNAGNGKTYTIINKIIPEIKKKKKSFCIISATHKALDEYYTHGYNAHVIDYYYYNEKERHDLKKYDYILIDEVGLLQNRHWDFLHNYINRKCTYIGAGDTTQLKPVMHKNIPLENPFISKIFKRVIYKNDNWRNNFTEEDYNNMRNGKYNISDNDKLKGLFRDVDYIEKYGEIKDYNICYYNDTVIKINNKITQKFKDTINNLKIKIGAKFFCTTNKFISEKLYNNMSLVVDSYNDNNIVFTDGRNIKYTIETKAFNKENFSHGYASTLYKIQGQSIEKDKLHFWDVPRLMLDGRTIYTALSRIKETLINIPV